MLTSSSSSSHSILDGSTEGFEVVVVRDATAGPRVAAGDGYLAALTNYSFLANAMWMTEEAVSHIRGGGVHSPASVAEVAATV